MCLDMLLSSQLSQTVLLNLVLLKTNASLGLVWYVMILGYPLLKNVLGG